MVDFWLGLYVAALVSLFFTATVRRAFLWYGINSLMLGLIALAVWWQNGDKALLISGLMTVLLKGFVIPLLLIRASSALHMRPYLKPSIPVPFNILLIPLFVVGSWFLFSPLQPQLGQVTAYLAMAVSAMLLALLFMVEQRHLAAKIVGFLLLENSLFLLGTLATSGMPMLVELGIFFDLLMAVIVVNILLRQEAGV